MRGYAEALEHMAIAAVVCFVLVLAACGGLGGLLFGQGFWAGAGCGAALAVILVAVVVLLWWLGVPL